MHLDFFIILNDISPRSPLDYCDFRHIDTGLQFGNSDHLKDNSRSVRSCYSAKQVGRPKTQV